jgi:hypothetical protein
MATYNIDNFLRAKKTVQLGGIEIDITMVPLIVNASLDEIMKDMKGIAEREKSKEITEADNKKGSEILKKIVSLALLVISKNDNPDYLDEKWLMESTDNFGLWNFLTIAANKDLLVTKSVDVQQSGSVGQIKKKAIRKRR